MDEKQQEIIDEVKKDRAYNLETLDLSLLKYSATGVGLFSCIYGCIFDKICSSLVTTCSVLVIGFLCASVACQLLSFRIAIVSQNCYLLFFYESDREEKLEAVRRFKIFHCINTFLGDAALCSFILACISLVVTFWGGLQQ
jgi:hypothetical protein